MLHHVFTISFRFHAQATHPETVGCLQETFTSVLQMPRGVAIGAQQKLAIFITILAKVIVVRGPELASLVIPSQDPERGRCRSFPDGRFSPLSFPEAGGGMRRKSTCVVAGKRT